MDKWLVRKMGIAFFLFLLFSFSAAEKVGKLTYTGKPEDINDSTVEVPSEAVVMSEKVQVSQSTDVIEGIIDSSTPPSIFFVIDHSGSMFWSSTSSGMNGKNPVDSAGNRFVVTQKLLDTINTTYPEAEVGISLFAGSLYFHVGDDGEVITDLDDGNNGDYFEGGYLKLLTLNKTYNSILYGSKTGYQLISDYLKTRTSNTAETDDAGHEYVTIDYAPTNTALPSQGTNITAGFESAKDAFKYTTNDVNNQYVIFFSDGEANRPSTPLSEQNKFMEGDNVPTTFTIYFTEDGEVPTSIETMTENIKKNNYSDNNENSKNWPYDNTQNADSLTQFLFDSVFSLIKTQVVSKPLEVTVNDKKPDGTPVEIDGKFIYTFSSTFPFTDEENDFKYVIEYTSQKPDPDDPNKLIAFDTTVTSNFTIKLTPDATLDTSIFNLELWDRSIKFYDDNDNELSSLYEAVNNLKVRFEVKKVDIIYDYSNVEIEAVSVDSSFDGAGVLTDVKILDKETLTLTSVSSTDSTEVFSATIPIKLANVNQNNGTLETDFVDDFYFTFRNKNNPKLPLDTLVAHIQYKVSGVINMAEATYFDKKDGDGNKGADGLVDSIYIALINDEKLDFDNDDLDKFMENLNLPSYRDFEVLKSSISQNGISLNVKQKANVCNTSIHKDDVIRMEQITLDSGYVSSSSVVPLDAMAPVIVSARAIQYEAESDTTIDTLIVRFSEPVEDINFSEPFLFMDSKTELNYNSVELTFLNNNKDAQEVSFQIDKINRANEVINDGDSIWIHTIGSSVVEDTDNKLVQQEENNIKRPIQAFYVVKPFDIEVKVTGPIDFIKPDENSAIDIKIIEKLDPENLEQLKQTGDDEFHGLLIVGETIQADDEDPKDIELKGDFAIYDYLGNSVWKASKMTFDEETKTLYYVWNGKNTKGRIVGSGTYVSVMHIETISTISGEVTEERNIKKFLNVKN